MSVTRPSCYRVFYDPSTNDPNREPGWDWDMGAGPAGRSFLTEEDAWEDAARDYQLLLSEGFWEEEE